MSLCVESRPVPKQIRTDEGQRVARMLRELREAADMSQEELARRIGKTLSGYRSYEQGFRVLKHDQIELFATALNVPVSAITSRLWPPPDSLTTTRHGADLEAITRSVESLPPAVAADLIRMWKLSIEIAQASPTGDAVNESQE